MKKLFKYLLSFIIALTIFSPTLLKTEAASKKAPITSLRYVKVSGSKAIAIKSEAKSSSFSYTKVQNGDAVMITGKKKGQWTELYTTNLRGYIQTKYLEKAKPQPNKKYTSYTMNTSKKYTYKDLTPSRYDRRDTITTNFVKKNFDIINTWIFTQDPTPWGYFEFETSRGLYTGIGEEFALHLTVKYPVKKKQEFGRGYKVVNTNATIYTNAGTFDNVIAIKKGKTTNFYSPSVGRIQSINPEYGFTLVKLK